ncbi:MAG: 5'/3'-nucleotidase SurE [Treponema sp.]|nr:5'/3'-nucleotidase SurE [Treponema sp.]
MNVLLTNDDGIQADGMKVMRQSLEKAGHTVYVLAPSGNRSGISSKISFFNDLEMYRYSEREWSSSGTPADCVITAFTSGIISEKIDVVVAGINAGANIGTDIVYSGTCGAARQAALYGYPGIAVSLDKETVSDYEDFEYKPLASFVAENLHGLCSLAVTDHPRGFVNINAFNLSCYKGAVICNKASVRSYNDRICVRKNECSCGSSVTEKDAYISTFSGGNIQTDCSEGTDFGACSNGYIAISVIQAEPAVIKVEKDIKFTL